MIMVMMWECHFDYKNGWVTIWEGARRLSQIVGFPSESSL